MNAIATHLIPTPDWPAALDALASAQAAEDAYDADVWRPAYAARDAGGPKVPDFIEIEITRLQDARCAAEEVMVSAVAPDTAAVLHKIEYARKRWSEFEDWPETWWDAVLADLRRLSGGEGQADMAQADVDAIEFEPILDVAAVAAFHREKKPGIIAWLGIALGISTQGRADMADHMRKMPTEVPDDQGLSNADAVINLTILREWLEDTTKIVRAVEYRTLIVAEQIARERGELEDAA